MLSVEFPPRTEPWVARAALSVPLVLAVVVMRQVYPTYWNLKNGGRFKYQTCRSRRRTFRGCLTRGRASWTPRPGWCKKRYYVIQGDTCRYQEAPLDLYWGRSCLGRMEKPGGFTLCMCHPVVNVECFHKHLTGAFNGKIFPGNCLNSTQFFRLKPSSRGPRRRSWW